MTDRIIFWILIILCLCIITKGSNLILLSKGKFAGKTIKEGRRKYYFIFGVVLYGIGLSMIFFIFSIGSGLIMGIIAVIIFLLVFFLEYHIISKKKNQQE